MATNRTARDPIPGWFRGNLHMHSFWSDGHHFPEMVAQHFKDSGYQFIAFTEHDRFQEGDKWVPTEDDTATGRSLRESGFLDEYKRRFGSDWVEVQTRPDGEYVRIKTLAEYRCLVEEPGRFIILNGEEVTVKSASTTHWVNVINAPEPICGIDSTGDAARAINETVERTEEFERTFARPVIASLNHPNYLWNATAEDIARAESLHFFEVHTALNCTFPCGDEMHPGAERIWDVVLAKRLGQGQGSILYGIGTDDCHVYHRTRAMPAHENGASMPCRAWIMVRAPELTPEALIRSMKTGDFYVSTGIVLRSLLIDDSGLELAVQPELGVKYTIRFIGTRQGVDLRGAPSKWGDRVTCEYSCEIGETLHEVKHTEAKYTFKGDELYVRAQVISDAPHPNPTVPLDTMKAWTQPAVRGRATL